jgi:hypothetical protein
MASGIQGPSRLKLTRRRSSGAGHGPPADACYASLCRDQVINRDVLDAASASPVVAARRTLFQDPTCRQRIPRTLPSASGLSGFLPAVGGADVRGRRRCRWLLGDLAEGGLLISSVEDAPCIQLGMVGPLLSGHDKRNGGNGAKMAVTGNCGAGSAQARTRARASASPSLFHCKRWPSSGIDQGVCPASTRHPPITSRRTRFAAVLSNQEFVRPCDDTLNNSIREAAERFRRRRGPRRGWRKTYL